MFHVALDLWSDIIETLNRRCTKAHPGRATGEPDVSRGAWSKGFGAAGYSLMTNITKLMPDTTAYPVRYPVSFPSVT
jgi:hypothetical protein